MTETNPCHPAEQQARQDRLEAAYLESGRTSGIYTGLVGSAAEESDPTAEEGLTLRDVDDGIDVANEAAATINARLARLGLRLTEPSVEALWRAVGGLNVVEVEGEAEPRPGICRACRFWYKYPARFGGECRRYAPRAVAVTEKDIEEAEDNHPERFVWFIETSEDDWCGEFEPKVQANG